MARGSVLITGRGIIIRLDLQEKNVFKSNVINFFSVKVGILINCSSANSTVKAMLSFVIQKATRVFLFEESM